MPLDFNTLSNAEKLRLIQDMFQGGPPAPFVPDIPAVGSMGRMDFQGQRARPSPPAPNPLAPPPILSGDALRSINEPLKARGMRMESLPLAQPEATRSFRPAMPEADPVSQGLRQEMDRKRMLEDDPVANGLLAELRTQDAGANLATDTQDVRAIAAQGKSEKLKDELRKKRAISQMTSGLASFKAVTPGEILMGQDPHRSYENKGLAPQIQELEYQTSPEQDPSSELSRSTRAMAEMAIGKGAVPPGASHAQIIQAMPFLRERAETERSKFEGKQRAELFSQRADEILNRQREKDQAISGRQERGAELKVDTAREIEGIPRKLPVGEVRKQADEETAIRNTDWLIENIEDPDVQGTIGPAAGRIGTLENQLGFSSPKVKQFRQVLAGLRNDYINAKTGKQLSQAEEQRLLQALPSANDNLPAFKAALRESRRLLTEMLQRSKGALKEAGYRQAGSGTVRMLNPQDGKSYDVDESEAAEAEANGWTRQ